MIPVDPPPETFHHTVSWRITHLMRWAMTKAGRFYLRCSTPDCNVAMLDPQRRHADPDFF